MLRKRRALTDDRALLSIVSSELLPLTRRSQPDAKFNKKLVKKRFSEGNTFVAVNRAGAIRGFITYVIAKDVLFIDMLAVHPAAQGKGWGTRLMEKAERAGKKANCQDAILYVDRDNEPGKAFYRKLGYRQERYVDKLKCYLFSKSLLQQENHPADQSAGDPFSFAIPF